MITKELIDYIKLLKQKGVNNEVIKNNLLKSNWSEQDINQAFLEIDKKQMMDPQSQVVPEQSDFNFNEKEEEKPKIIKILSNFFYFIGILYVFSTLNFAGIVLITDFSMQKNGLVFSYLKDFPTLGYLPILFSIMTLLFFYSGLKINNGSKFSFWLGLITLFTQFPAAFLSQYLLKSFFALILNQKENTENIFNFNLLNIKFNDPIFALSFIALILLIFSYKKFKFTNQSISKKGKILIITLIVVFILPIYGLIFLSYLNALDQDYGFTKVRSKVSYHLYRPSYIPGGRFYITKFNFGEKLAGFNNAVGVRFGPSLKEKIQKTDKAVGVIQLVQVGVNDKFDLNSFIKKSFPTSVPKKILISLAKNGEGYYFEKNMFKFINFVTKDNTLIVITTDSRTSEEEIRAFVSGLQ